MLLSDFIKRQKTKKQTKPSPKGQSAPAPAPAPQPSAASSRKPSLLSDMIRPVVRRVTQQVRPPVARQQAQAQAPAGQQRAIRGMPDAVARAIDLAVVEQSAQSTPRPSEAFRRMLTTLGKDSGWALDHRGELLALLRTRLPNQPETPMKRGPHRRKVPMATGWRKKWKQENGYVIGRPLAAEAFTGAGLFSFACHVEGVYATEVCEIEPMAVETLKVNLHDHAEVRDALVWTPSVPDGGLDLLLGGPPCQPFSRGASLGQGEYGTASPKNMYPRILDWVADAQPRIVLMENSDQVATNASYRDYFDWWWKQMSILGYEGVFWRVDASDYGTPQARKRAIAVAWPKGAPWGAALRTKPAPTHGDPGSEAVKSGRLLPWTHAFDRLASGCCGGYGLVGCIFLGNMDYRCSSCIEGANFQAAPNQTAKQARTQISKTLLETYAGMFDYQFSRLEKRRPTPGSIELAFKPREVADRLVTEWLSPTLTAGGGAKRAQESLVIPQTGTGSVSSIDTHDPKQRKAFVAQLEMLSIREAAKLQDVPQYWQFEGSRAQAWTQIGNGIPVNLGRAMIRKALDALGYPNPIPHTMAAIPFEGLWPMDAVDMCARSPDMPQGLEEHISDDWAGAFIDGDDTSGIVPNEQYEEWIPRWKKTLTQAERRARPFVNVASAQQSRKRGAILKQRETWWQDTMMSGVWDPNWEKILAKWNPKTATEVPPGFLDFDEMFKLLDGEEEEYERGMIQKYADLMGVSPDVARQHLWKVAEQQGRSWWY